MPARLIRLRYPATCAACGADLAAKTSAWWNPGDKLSRCEACGPGSNSDVEPESTPASVDRDEPAIREAAPPRGPDVGIAGGSAQAEYERRKSRRETSIRARHPRLGGLILALSDDPRSTTAWEKGAEGERQLGASLDSLAAAGVVAMHDRRIPGSRANIDHLAVTPTGVWVIDAKRYTGQIARKDVGGWLTTDVRLYVGRRDSTSLIGAMAKQVEVVRAALGTEHADVPVHSVLCFVDAEWGWFAKPFCLDGVLITWGKALRERLGQPGTYTPEAIDLIARHLDSKLMPAT